MKLTSIYKTGGLNEMDTKKEYGNLSIKRQGDKFGFVDTESGLFMVDPIFDEIRDVNCQYLFFAYMGGKLFRVQDSYHEYFASFYNELDERKFLMKTGTVLDYPIRIINGYGLYQVNSHCGVVNESYQIIIPPTFDSSGDYDEIISLKRYLTDIEMKFFNTERQSYQLFFVKSITYFTRDILDYKWGFYEYPYNIFCFYDQRLNLVIFPNLDECMIIKGVRRYFLNNKYGLISESENKITENIYDDLALEYNSRNIYRFRINDRLGFINENGNIFKKSTGSQFQRICQNQKCGKVWFTYVSDEAELNPSTGTSFVRGFFAGLAGDNANIDYRVKKGIDRRDLLKLRSCPACGSTNIEEEII